MPVLGTPNDVCRNEESHLVCACEKHLCSIPWPGEMTNDYLIEQGWNSGWIRVNNHRPTNYIPYLNVNISDWLSSNYQSLRYFSWGSRYLHHCSMLQTSENQQHILSLGATNVMARTSPAWLHQNRGFNKSPRWTSACWYLLDAYGFMGAQNCTSTIW